MALPQLPGHEHHIDSMPEMVTRPKKHCVRSENNNCERYDNQRNDVAQLPGSEKQQNDITESPPSENQQYGVTEGQQYDNIEEEPDFSKLPTLVWTMIMSNLEEQDRLALAMTCRTFYSLCKTESILWRSAIMYLGNWELRWSACQVELNHTEISMLQAHCHQIENMTFVMRDLRGLRFSERSFHILNEAVTNWPLKKMIIDCSKAYSVCPVNPVINNVGQLIRNCLTSARARRLESLTIKKCCWTYPDKGSIILEALRDSFFTDSLKFLWLGPIRTTNLTKQLDLNHTIPQVVECVGRFPNLQELHLCVDYLTDALLETLSNSITSQCKKLNFNGSFKSFQEDITKWPQLLSSYPDLRVFLRMVGDINCEDTRAAFPPIVPVECVRVRDATVTGKHKGRRELLELLPAYSKTLTTLDWHDRSQSVFDSILIDTAKRCPNLVCLRFKGLIKSSSVRCLAFMRDWHSLTFPKSLITFCMSNTETQDKQMAELKAAVFSRLGHKFHFVKYYTPFNPNSLPRPIRFKVKCQPVHL